MAKVINSIRLLNLARQRVKDCCNEVVELDESPEGKALYLTFLSVEHLYRLGAITKEQRNEMEAEYEEYYQQSAGRAIKRDLQAQKDLDKIRTAMKTCNYAEALRYAMDLLSMSDTPLGSVDYNEFYKLYYREEQLNADI